MKTSWSGEPVWPADLTDSVARRLVQCKEQLTDFAIEQVLSGTPGPSSDLPFDDYLRLDAAYIEILLPHQVERTHAIAAEAEADIEKLLTDEQRRELHKVGFRSLLARIDFDSESRLIRGLYGPSTCNSAQEDLGVSVMSKPPVFEKSMFQEKMDANRQEYHAQRLAEADPLAVHKFMRREEWELKGLHDLCKWLRDRGCNMGMCIEVGSFMGESALVFAQYFDAVICVDPFEFVGPGFDENIDNLSHAGLSRDIVRQGFRENTSSVNNIALVEKPDSAVNLRADIVYIDSEHTFVECLAAINRWKDRVTWVTGHDYVCADVKLAVDSAGRAVVFEDHSWVLDH